MESTDLTRAQRHARVAYERGRLRQAALGALPVVALAAVAVSLTDRPAATAAICAAAVGLALGLLWYGRVPQRAVLPGLVSGAVPLALALAAKDLHSCVGDHCTSWCVPACTLGGVVAAIVVGWVAYRRRAGLRFWLAASGVALAVGAMGCSCAGYAGVIGLAAGYGAISVLGLPFARALRRS